MNGTFIWLVSGLARESDQRETFALSSRDISQSLFSGLGFIAFYQVSHGNGNGQTLFYVGLIVSAIVFLGVLLGSKVTEPIGEWRALLANRGGQSEGYYRMITAVLERRRLPIKPQLRRIELNGRAVPSSTRSC